MNLKRSIITIATNALMLSGALGVMILAKTVDTSRPIVQNFKLTSEDASPNGVILEGTMEKVRDCRDLEVTAYTSDGRQVYVRFMYTPEAAHPANRAVRFQVWGPWEVWSGESDTVSLYALHSCHMLWTQTTHLGEIKFVKAKQ